AHERRNEFCPRRKSFSNSGVDRYARSYGNLNKESRNAGRLTNDIPFLISCFLDSFFLLATKKPCAEERMADLASFGGITRIRFKGSPALFKQFAGLSAIAAPPNFYSRSGYDRAMGSKQYHSFIVTPSKSTHLAYN